MLINSQANNFFSQESGDSGHNANVGTLAPSNSEDTGTINDTGLQLDAISNAVAAAPIDPLTEDCSVVAQDEEIAGGAFNANALGLTPALRGDLAHPFVCFDHNPCGQHLKLSTCPLAKLGLRRHWTGDEWVDHC